MELDKIENKIACNELNASQVFTQMKQHIYRQAPCKNACESKAFEIEIRRLKDKMISSAAFLVRELHDDAITEAQASRFYKLIQDLKNT